MKAYIFRGAPASGKGTITKEFIKMISGKVVLLELDNFRWGFHLYNREVKDVCKEEHAFAYQNFLLMLESYCKNGQYNLVVEGLFSWDKKGVHGNMNDIITILKRHGFEYKAFYLRANKNVLWKRNTKRKYVVPAFEFEDLCNYVGKEVPGKEIDIDVENNGSDEISKLLEVYL